MAEMAEHENGQRVARGVPGSFFVLVDRLDRSVTNIISPIGVTVLGCATLYYTALSYGIVVVAMVGGRTGLARLMVGSGSHPMLVIIGIPMIPVSLVLLEAAELEEKTLKLWRNKISPFMSQVPIVGRVMEYFWPSLTREPFAGNRNGDSMGSTLDYLARSIAGGLLLPFCGYLIGMTIFKPKMNIFYKTLIVREVTIIIMM
jgi:hypothetical protein